MTRRSQRRKAAASSRTKVAASGDCLSPEIRDDGESAFRGEEKETAESLKVTHRSVFLQSRRESSKSNSEDQLLDVVRDAAAEAAGSVCSLFSKREVHEASSNNLVDLVRSLAFQPAGFSDSCFRLPLYSLLLKCCCSTWACWLIACFLLAKKRLGEKRRSLRRSRRVGKDRKTTDAFSSFQKDSAASLALLAPQPFCRLQHSALCVASEGESRRGDCSASRGCCSVSFCRGICCFLRRRLEFVLGFVDSVRRKKGEVVPEAVAVLLLLDAVPSESPLAQKKVFWWARGEDAEATKAKDGQSRHVSSDAAFLKVLFHSLLGRLPDDESPAFRAAQLVRTLKDVSFEDEEKDTDREALLSTQLSWLGERRLLANSADASQIEHDVRRSLTAWKFEPFLQRRKSAKSLRQRRGVQESESLRPCRQKTKRDSEERRPSQDEWLDVKTEVAPIISRCKDESPSLRVEAGCESPELSSSSYHAESDGSHGECSSSESDVSDEVCNSSSHSPASVSRIVLSDEEETVLSEADVSALREALRALLIGILARHEPLLLYTQGLHDVVSAVLLVVIDAARKFIWARRCLLLASIKAEKGRNGASVFPSEGDFVSALRETPVVSWKEALHAVEFDERSMGLHACFSIGERVSLAYLGEFLSKPFERSLMPAMQVLSVLLERRSPALCSLLRVSSAAAIETPGGEVLSCVPWIITLFAHSPGLFSRTARLLDAVLASHPRFVLHLAVEVIASRRAALNNIWKKALSNDAETLPFARWTDDVRRSAASARSAGEEPLETEQRDERPDSLSDLEEDDDDDEEEEEEGEESTSAKALLSADAKLHASLSSHPELLEEYRQLVGDRVSGEVHAALYSIRLETLRLERILRRARKGLFSGEIQEVLSAASSKGVIALPASSPLLLLREPLTGAFAGDDGRGATAGGPEENRQKGNYECSCASLQYPDSFFFRRRDGAAAERLAARYDEAVKAERTRQGNGEGREALFQVNIPFCQTDARCQCAFLFSDADEGDSLLESVNTDFKSKFGSKSLARKKLVVHLYCHSAEDEERPPSPDAIFSQLRLLDSLPLTLRVVVVWLVKQSIVGAHSMLGGSLQWGESIWKVVVRTFRKLLSPLFLCSGAVLCVALFLRFCLARGSRAASQALNTRTFSP